MTDPSPTPPAGPLADIAPPLGRGRFRLREILGEGGMATVYLAWDTSLRVPRAVKVLAPRLAARPGIRQRFEAEATTMARLAHPAVVPVHDVGEEDGRAYMVMDLLRGGSLGEQVERGGPLAAAEAIRLLRPVVDAIGAAHAAGIVHRDVKPHNILLTDRGEPRITDFGIAQVREDESAASLTRTGVAMGTWGFMSPEQRQSARRVDGRADIYALGATLYALVTGRQPVDLFAASMDAGLLDGIDPSVAAIIQRATAYRPEDRFPDAAALAAAFDAAARGELPLTPLPAPGRGAPFAAGATLAPETFDPPAAPTVALHPASPLAHATSSAPTVTGHTAPPADGPALPPPVAPTHRGALRGPIFGMGAIFLLGSVLFAVRLRPTDAPPLRTGEPPTSAAPAPTAAAAPAAAPPPRPDAGLRARGSEGADGAVAPAEEAAAAGASTGGLPGAATGAPAGADRAGSDVAESSGAPPMAEPRPGPDTSTAPPPQPGRVRVEGDATAITLLAADGREHRPGPLPAGDYTLRVSFPGHDAIPGGGITVGPGADLLLRCDAHFLRCRVMPP